MSDRPIRPTIRQLLPQEPIDRIVGPLARFMHIETTSGVVLVAAMLAALAWANSPWGETYEAFWMTEVEFHVGTFQFDHSLKHLINDALMAIFFFVIGLEVKREIVLGELRDLRVAALPVAAAVGGMIAPALMFLAIEGSGEARYGWGIPMATDIAFVVGCMALLGLRIPASLRVILLSLAIADDIGAIVVIAVGYSHGLHVGWLAGGLAGIAGVSVLARLGARQFLIYTLLGVFIWYCFHESGVHATIAGVILGLMTPARNYLPPERFINVMEAARHLLEGETWASERHRAERLRRFQWATRETISPLEYLESLLHPWVAYAVIPAFALANAGVPFEPAVLGSTTTLAVAAGLVIGKPIGVFAAAQLAVLVGLARRPECGWGLFFAGGCLAGIGFTMSLFIGELALAGDPLTRAKIGVLTGSLVAAAFGMSLICLLQPRPATANGPEPGAEPS